MLASLLAMSLQVVSWREQIDYQDYEHTWTSSDGDTVMMVRSDYVPSRIWVRYETADGETLSSVHLYSVDCADRSYTGLQDALYAGRNMTGESRAYQDYRKAYAAPQTFAHAFVEWHCAKR